jgi:hypothetical protein
MHDLALFSFTADEQDAAEDQQQAGQDTEEEDFEHG